jgi:hypothetical protein
MNIIQLKKHNEKTQMAHRNERSEKRQFGENKSTEQIRRMAKLIP